MVFVDIVFLFLIGLKVLSLSVSRRSSRKNSPIYLVYFRLKLTNSVIDCLLFLGLGCLGGKT